MSMSGDDATTTAAELAEGILDEVSSADQDWRKIASRARELASVADVAAARPEMSPVDPERLAIFFVGLSHATRILILNALRDGERRNPAELVEDLDRDVSLGDVAYHTRRLAELGLLTRAGGRPARGAFAHYYRVSPRGREAIALVDQVSRTRSA
jgi:DNA-binding transcriptional ArsR family regulator